MSHTAKDLLVYQEKNILNRTDLDVPHTAVDLCVKGIS